MHNSISKFHNSLINKEFSCTELIKQYIKNIETSKTNSFITTTFDSALEKAAHIDQKISSGEKISILEGIPISIKDLYCTKGVRTTCGSKMLENFTPIYNATIVDKITQAGSISMGKVNMDEFAMGSMTKNQYFGNTINVLKDKRSKAELTAGGSSGGSASSVKENLCLASFGSDTGGSVRQPASLCGLVGYKPSYGICSRYGMISYASSFDTVSSIANSVEDAALVINAVKGYDIKDSTSIEINNIQEKSIDKEKIIIGIPTECLKEMNLKEYISQSMDNFSQKVSTEKTIEVIEIDMRYILKYALDIYYLLTTVEAYSNLSKYDGIRYGFNSFFENSDIKNIDELYKTNRSIGFGSEVKRRLILGGYTISGKNYKTHYLKAAQIRRIIKNKVDEIFTKCDIIATPTTNTVAFDINKKLEPLEIYKNDLFTVLANLTGMPSISIPIEQEKESGLPIGIMFSGRYLQDDYLIKHSKIFENIINY